MTAVIAIAAIMLITAGVFVALSFVRSGDDTDDSDEAGA